MVVIKLVHEGFVQDQYAHACVNRSLEEDFFFVHLNPCQVVAKNGKPCLKRVRNQLSYLVSLVKTNQSHVDAVSEIPHRLTENRVVRQLEEILLEVTLCTFCNFIPSERYCCKFL